MTEIQCYYVICSLISLQVKLFLIMNNKENKLQPKVAKVPCTKLILNKQQPQVKSISETTKSAYLRNVNQETVHTARNQKLM
jgi:hypothetical protein